MNNDSQAKENVKGRRPLQKWAVVAFIVFFILGYLLASPCLCREGSVKGFYKSIFYIIVIARLLYGIFERNLKVIDFILWVCSFIGFVSLLSAFSKTLITNRYEWVQANALVVGLSVGYAKTAAYAFFSNMY